MVVQHNLRAMNSNRMLGLTASTQSKSTEKLSSGYKINRAADDAAGLSISEKMRKQIRGLSQASLNAADGISAVQTAEGALNEVQDMLQRMNELAVKAANGTMSEDDRGYIQDEIDQLTTEINRVAETTKFNESYLLKGDATAAKEFTASYAETDVPASATKTAANIYDKDGNELADADAIAAYLDANEGEKLYKTEASWTVNGTFYANTGTDDTGAVEVTADNASTYFNEDGTAKANYKFWTTTDAGGNTEATVTGAVTFTAAEEAVAGTDYTFTPAGAPALYDVNGNKISANGLDGYFDIAEDGTATLKDGKTLYTDDKATNALAADDIETYVTTSQTKTAALTLKLHVGADATANNQITIDMDAMSAEGLGVNGLEVDGSDDTNALDAIETIKAAIQKVSTQRSALGAVQNRLEHTIANLDNVVENTTAAESQIRDTDMATEMVKYSNNNILAQAGQAMLAQANQANQGVLSLLG